MFDEKAIIGMIAASSQEECREIGELFMSFVDQPRDVHWKAQYRRQLEQFPAEAESDLAKRIAAGRARLAQDDEALRATGWHPEQMRKKLVELGYNGSSVQADGRRDGEDARQQ